MIGIIGASGKIGSEIIKTLNVKAPQEQLRCGYHSNRRSDGNQWVCVDIDDRNDIKAFMEGCALVINTAGPSERYSQKVMEAALECGVSLIDVGHSRCYAKTTRLNKGQRMIYACGAVPGIIGFIPRKLAEDFDHIYSLNVNIALREMLTLTAARDLVTASQLPDGKASGIKAKTENIPLIGDEVYRYQFSDEESAAIDTLLHVRSSSWYMVRDTDDYEKLFSSTYKDKDEMAERLCRLYRISMAGREDYLKFVIEMEGMKDNRPKTVSAYLNGISGSVVSGRVAAAAALALLRGEIAENVPVRLAMLQNDEKIWEYVEKTEAFRLFEVYPYSLAAMSEEESGEI